MDKELKTLKDLKIAGHEVVRAEAIKWVKEGRKNLKKYNDRDHRLMETGISLFIKDFFNLTEEDLK